MPTVLKKVLDKLAKILYNSIVYSLYMDLYLWWDYRKFRKDLKTRNSAYTITTAITRSVTDMAYTEGLRELRKKVLVKTGKLVLDTEGRFLLLEFKDFFLINLYFPNSQRQLKRLDYKLLQQGHALQMLRRA